MLFSEKTLTDARGLFPYLRQGRLYLNHAGTSPLSTRVVAAMTEYLQRRSEGALDTYPMDCAMVEECRSFIATLVNAESPGRIAFQFNTSDAINILASGIPWKSGDHILLGNIEFPANVHPYLNLRPLGVHLDFIPSADGRVTAAMIESQLTNSTRLVAMSAVQFLSGYRADLRAIGELCRKKGIIFAVDGIQAVGAVEIDVQRMKIDFLAAGAQKWQMGPHGCSFLYLTDDLQSRIRQKSLGWLALENPWNFYDYDQPLASSARRYEGGSLNMPGLWGMHAAISTILGFGQRAIESHILSITAELIDGLRAISGVRIFTPTADDERGGIVTISLDGQMDPQILFTRMEARGMTIALREGKLRYSPHFYNSSDDIRRAVELTASCMAPV